LEAEVFLSSMQHLKLPDGRDRLASWARPRTFNPDGDRTNCGQPGEGA
jgi:hypothetical protein